MTYSRIIGTGGYLPEKVLTNFDLEKMLDTSDAWIVERTGIKERRIAEDFETTSTMAIEAAKKAIITANIEPEKIDLIIVATSTPENFFPSTACIVQQALNIKQCPAFDISAACAGFNYALSTADNFIRAGAARHALVIGSETMSRTLDWTDRGTCILFGDGAGAIVLEANEKPGILSNHLYSNGQYKDLLYYPSGVHPNSKPRFLKMNGSEIFKIAVNKLGEILDETLAANNLTHSSLDWLVPHQANLRIISAMARKLHLPMERVVITLDKQGNTSAASVPLALDAAIRDGRIQRGHTILLESFGGGLTWGAALVRY